ncbi:MAG: hypothetical protein AABY53_03005 [Bdellovibrionota bacterium]
MFKNETLIFRINFLIVLLLLQTSCNVTKFSYDSSESLSSLSGSNSDSGSDSVYGSDVETYTNSTPPVNTPIVQQACSNVTGHRVQDFNYFFPKPQETCNWGNNGNLAIRNGFFQARIEQEQALALENGAIICDIKFSFQKQQFLYDDHFILSFNDALIASSYDFQERLTPSFGLLRYDWSKMAGMTWDNRREGVLCPAGGQCSWPDTDIPGNISINYPSILFQRLMAENLNRNSHSIKFISIGDNDNFDCEHSDINFSMKVDYVVPLQ